MKAIRMDDFNQDAYKEAHKIATDLVPDGVGPNARIRCPIATGQRCIDLVTYPAQSEEPPATHDVRHTLALILCYAHEQMRDEPEACYDCGEKEDRIDNLNMELRGLKEELAGVPDREVV